MLWMLSEWINQGGSEVLDIYHSWREKFIQNFRPEGYGKTRLGLEGTRLVKDTICWRLLVNTGMILPVPWKAGSFLTILVIQASLA
jgi:hypothetical protein